jgi:hypothetical protein
MRKIAAFCFLLACFGFIAVSAAPDLVRDTFSGGQWQPTSEWAAEKAKCTRHALVVSNCSVTAVHRFSPSEGKRNLTYFTFADWGGQRVDFVRSGSDPRHISLRSATDGLTGRWIFLLVVLGMILLLCGKAATTLRASPA